MAREAEEPGPVAARGCGAYQRGTSSTQRLASVGSLAIRQTLTTTDNHYSISQYSDMKHDPTDPVSAAFLTTYDVVSGIMLGLIAGPVELGKQTTPMLLQREIRRKEKCDGTANPSSPLDTKDSPHVARQVALGTAKGFGRIITTSLKSPAIVMHGITRGFHNLPKAYGGEVRQYENVTGLRSGLLVSFKSFGYGLSDGIADLIIKPIDGAEKNGVLGFAAGCATGVMNAAFKPAAGKWRFVIDDDWLAD